MCIVILMQTQIRQILDWSGEPEQAFRDFDIFLNEYQKVSGHPFDLEPINAKRLLSIFGNSYFLTHFILQYPLEADTLVNSPCIETDKKIEDYREDLNALFPALQDSSLLEFGKKIRLYKYREFLRMTVKDLSQAAGMESLLGEISDLAIAIAEVCFNFFHPILCKQYGISILSEEDSSSSAFSIIAQGKLGGRELNYSSDIDIQFIYDSASPAFKNKEISSHEFFVKLSEKILCFLSEKSEDGFLYRVDMNLRPEGNNGPLANSLLGIEQYYESFGEEWERQALIKALPIVGDFQTGKQFMEIVSPFVWRKSFDLNSIEKLKEIKNKVHDAAKKSPQKGYNVKLGEGGIREIEYFIQILQLLYGGKHPELRIQSTLEALRQLEKLQLISNRDALQLKDAYLFLRKVEHRLQCVNEAQTHHIPADAKQQIALARRMGYFEENPEESRQRFLDDLTRYQTFVKSTFENLFNPDSL